MTSKRRQYVSAWCPCTTTLFAPPSLTVHPWRSSPVVSERRLVGAAVEALRALQRASWWCYHPESLFLNTQTKKWSLTRSQFYYYFNPANKKMYKIVFPYRQSTRANLSVLLMALKVLQLPYNRGNEIWRSLSLCIYLPNAKDGLESLVERMCSEHGFLDKYVPSKYITLGEFKIPKFKISYEL